MPRTQWHLIRAVYLLTPEAVRILQLAIEVDNVLPRATLPIRTRFSSREDRLASAQQLVENIEAFWSAVDNLRQAVRKIAPSAGSSEANERRQAAS